MTRTTEHRELDLAFEPTRTGVVTTIRVGRSTLRVTQDAPDEMELPFADGSFARVVCLHGLQLLPDRGRVLREMHRVLAPGGEVDVEVPGSDRAESRVRGASPTHSSAPRTTHGGEDPMALLHV